MINVEQNVFCGEMWRNLSCGEIFPHDRLLHMFCRNFTHFCVEKSFSQKLCLWRKQDKYLVCFCATHPAATCSRSTSRPISPQNSTLTLGGRISRNLYLESRKPYVYLNTGMTGEYIYRGNTITWI